MWRGSRGLLSPTWPPSRKVEQVREELNKKEGKVEETVKDQQWEMYEELRQRELRKKNVIFHGIQEL
jgi:hypothetical protein